MRRFFLGTILTLIVGFPLLTNAGLLTNELRTNVQPNSGYAVANERTASEIVGRFLRAFLSFLGIIFLGLIVYAGFKWMTAQGNEEEVTKAQALMKQAVMGLIIILAAATIKTFVFRSLRTASSPTPPAQTP